MTVASLGLVSPGAATDGVTPIFLKNLMTFLVITFCITSTVPPLFFLKNLTTFFAHHYCHFSISLGCHPLQGVTRTFSYLSHRVWPLFFVNSATKNFIRVLPPGVCHPGRSPRARNLPSDAIDDECICQRVSEMSHQQTGCSQSGCQRKVQIAPVNFTDR